MENNVTKINGVPGNETFWQKTKRKAATALNWGKPIGRDSHLVRLLSEAERICSAGVAPTRASLTMAYIPWGTAKPSATRLTRSSTRMPATEAMSDLMMTNPTTWMSID